MAIRITHFLKPGTGDEDDPVHDHARRMTLSNSIRRAANTDILGPAFIGVTEARSHGNGPISLHFDFEDNEEESRAAVATFLRQRLAAG